MGELQSTGQLRGTTARPQITHSREISVICVLWQKLVVLNFYVSIMQIYCTYPCLNRTIARNAKRIQREAVELDQFLFIFLKSSLDFKKPSPWKYQASRTVQNMDIQDT